AAFSRAVRELELAGLVKRTSNGEFPPAVSYGLTSKGDSLSPVVKMLVKWGLANQGDYLQGEFGMAAFYKSTAAVRVRG
ncbi:MAG: winged helix-turn-helix transcriptional regulator, partial [Bdellovibrionota bacterium]